MLIYYLSLIDDPRDDEKFIQIYELYRNSMFNKANSILHNVQDAEDAVQEAFISIAKNIKKVSEPECHKTRRFIVIVITHKAVDIYRKNKNHYTVPLDDIVTCSLDEHAKSSPLADVMEHFAKLPEKYRTPLLLSVDQGYRSKEIAEILGERDDTIRKRLERGTKRLKELYDEAERKKSEGYDVI